MVITDTAAHSASATTWIHTLPFPGQRVTVSACAPGLFQVSPLLAPARSGLYTTDPCTGLLIPLEWWYYGCLPGFSVFPRPWGLFFRAHCVLPVHQSLAQTSISPGWASQDTYCPGPADTESSAGPG
ncbi:MAG UNVERIFIED_CONTAM: hypothetical protein LVR18_45305 [Planctomycetaceae bacterium]